MADAPVVAPLFNKVLDRAGVGLLASLYRRDEIAVAHLCDQHLDRSGALLGDVRTVARGAGPFW